VRALFVSSLWPPAVLGGAELYASRLASHLTGAGHEVGAVTLGVEGEGVVRAVRPWPYRLDAYGSAPGWQRALFHLRDQFDVASARAVTQAIAEFGPDVVHSHSVAGMSMAALAAPHRAGVAHVHTLHDYWLLCQRSSLQRADGTRCDERCTRCRIISEGRRTIARRHFAEVVIAVSEAVARHHRAAGFLSDRIRVVHNPVDVPDVVESRPPVRSPLRVGYLGSLIMAKGIRTLAQALSALGPEFAVVAGGVGPLAPALATLPGASMRGWLDAEGRDRLFADVDCLVVPSEWEDPAPMVVTEALVRGVPVIGARAGGIPELVPPPLTELLFPPGDAHALADRLRRFAADPSRYLGARPSVDPSWDHHLDAIMRAYTDAISAA
jgi:glycosyltransferase involved in cell wall biosynthesis